METRDSASLNLLSIPSQICDYLRPLSPQLQREVLNFVEYLVWRTAESNEDEAELTWNHMSMAISESDEDEGLFL